MTVTIVGMTVALHNAKQKQATLVLELQPGRNPLAEKFAETDCIWETCLAMILTLSTLMDAVRFATLKMGSSAEEGPLARETGAQRFGMMDLTMETMNVTRETLLMQMDATNLEGQSPDGSAMTDGLGLLMCAGIGAGTEKG